jgi:hypothetical protein
MHSRITEVAGGPGDGGSSFVQEKVLPGFESADGFEGLVLLVGKGGRGISVALFRDQDAVEATGEEAAGFRNEASNRGYEVNLVDTFEVVGSDVRGGDPRAARFLRLSGGGDLGAVFRDTVIPTFGAVDGYLGAMAGASDESGFGMSLWRDEASRDGANDAISQAREAMAAAGVNIDSVEELAVGIAQLPG